jgi:hypothetical protein
MAANDSGVAVSPKITCAALPGNHSSTPNTTMDVTAKVAKKLKKRWSTNEDTRYPCVFRAGVPSAVLAR